MPHRLYGHVDAAEACSAAAWAADARAAISEVVGEGRLPILVGGTGLYVRTLIAGIAPIPPIDPAVRAAVRAMDAAAAHAALVVEDKASAAVLHVNDTSRIQRALETIRSTGRPIHAWRAAREGGIDGLYRFMVEHVELPAAEGARRIDARVHAMFADGAVAEVAALAARGLAPDLPAMRAIGVPQIFAHLDGRATEAEAIAAIQTASRQYAKRQRTWFRHQSLF